jgi:hypothetical protein
MKMDIAIIQHKLPINNVVAKFLIRKRRHQRKLKMTLLMAAVLEIMKLQNLIDKRQHPYRRRKRTSVNCAMKIKGNCSTLITAGADYNKKDLRGSSALDYVVLWMMIN